MQAKLGKHVYSRSALLWGYGDDYGDDDGDDDVDDYGDADGDDDCDDDDDIETDDYGTCCRLRNGDNG